MCEACVRQLMVDEDLTELSVPEHLAPLVKRIKDFHDRPECSVGGPLHIVLDDTNVEDHFIQWCISPEQKADPTYGVALYGEETWVEAEEIAAELLAIESVAMRGLVTWAA